MDKMELVNMQSEKPSVRCVTCSLHEAMHIIRAQANKKENGEKVNE